MLTSQHHVMNLVMNLVTNPIMNPVKCYNVTVPIASIDHFDLVCNPMG